jgi:inorganic pyrophosphatase
VSERPITRAEVILSAKVVGGLQMLDGGEADDKIIAVLENDNFWGDVEDVSGLPKILVERLQHYFSTYKLVPGQEKRVSIEAVLDCQQAQKLVSAAMEDYQNAYGAQKQTEKG